MIDFVVIAELDFWSAFLTSPKQFSVYSAKSEFSFRYADWKFEFCTDVHFAKTNKSCVTFSNHELLFLTILSTKRYKATVRFSLQIMIFNGLCTSNLGNWNVGTYLRYLDLFDEKESWNQG